MDDDTVGAGCLEVAIAPSIPTEDGAVGIQETPPHHSCSQCPYSSPYKANVVRHIKLVHDSQMDEISNGASDDRKSSSLEDDEEIIGEFSFIDLSTSL